AAARRPRFGARRGSSAPRCARGWSRRPADGALQHRSRRDGSPGGAAMSFAPGKVILLGEHAVVYGHPALAGALDGGVHVAAAPGVGRLRVPAGGAVVEPGDGGSRLADAYQAIRSSLAALPRWRAP